MIHVVNIRALNGEGNLKMEEQGKYKNTGRYLQTRLATL